MKRLSITLALALILCLTIAPGAFAKDIKVGGVFDITGPTSTVGKDFAAGALAAQDYINKNGGIDGDMIKLIPNDYAYKIPEALKLFKKYSKVDDVLCIQGWGTGDTVKLAGLTAKAKIPYFSASFVGALTDPKRRRTTSLWPRPTPP